MTPGPGITRTLLPAGFSASGINCGVRKYRPDLGLILCDRDAVAVGVYTQSGSRAASVVYSRGLTPSSRIRAIVTNSGQANAATGGQGVETNYRMAAAVAKAIGCEPSQVLTASTGVIGVPLDIEKIEAAIPECASRALDIAEPFALAILTTDLIPKTVSTTIALSGGEVKLTGICKGSGMIHPNMATMLGYLLTDAVITPTLARRLLGDAVDASFNMISVDGDTSTNDAVFFMASGAAGAPVSSDADVALFRAALIELSQILAKAIARDGEGSTKLIEVALTGFPDGALARKAARGITVSPLVKAAVHGEDPNWGRIVARLGAEGVPDTCLARMALTIQGCEIMREGFPVAFDRDAVKKALRTDTVCIQINLASGEWGATAWGCDLSRKYVDINAEYST